MATGDNILTAISIGRQCNMLNQNNDIYVVDLTSVNGIESIKIDKMTYKEFEVADELTKPNKIVDKVSIDMKRNMNSISDLISIDDIKESDFGVAITGPAFNYLSTNPDYK